VLGACAYVVAYEENLDDWRRRAGAKRQPLRMAVCDLNLVTTAANIDGIGGIGLP
jgi:hypothetical protein